MIFLRFLGTCLQDGRSGVQGVSKGCQWGAPGDPNVAPAVPNLVQAAVNIAAVVQRVPMGCPWGPKCRPAVPNVAQAAVNIAAGVSQAAQRVPQGRPSGAPGSPKGVHALPGAFSYNILPKPGPISHAQRSEEGGGYIYIYIHIHVCDDRHRVSLELLD